MKLLSKFFLAVLLLTVVSVSWAACPEGYRNNFKGECAPVAKGTTDADTSDREDYDFECAEKTLGRQIIDQFSQGRPPSQDELQKIEHCRVGNRSTQSDGGKQQAKPPQSGERLNESNYNPGCVDATLGMQVTDQLIYGGRPPSQDELQKIEHCRVGNGSTQRDWGQEQVAPEDRTQRLKEADYDVECVDGTLGMQITDQLIYGGRPPSQDELQKIEHCLVKNSSAQRDSKQERATQLQTGDRFDVDA